MITRPDVRACLRTLALSASALAGLSAVAPGARADEDWRKMLDLKPAYVGDIWTANMPKTAAVESFASSNMSLLSWIPLNNFATGIQSANDCWGYTSPSGREYAIIGTSRGTGFVEITDPLNPVVLAHISGPTSLWRDIAVVGSYAYCVSEGGSGIQVIDLTNIDSGVVTFVKNKIQAGHSSTHTIVYNPTSGFLYLCGANISNGGLIAVSTANPTEPTIVGAWTTRYVHEAQVVSYTSGPYAGREIAFVFTGGPASGSSQGLSIVDVTNKASMVTLANLNYSGIQYSHQGWVSDDKQYLYLNDELDDQAGTAPASQTRVINISNLSAPFVTGTFTTGSGAIDHNQYVRGNFLYNGNYRSGLRVFSTASSATSPTQIAWFDTYPQDDRAQFNGVWGNYPFFPSGNVIVSDIERGLMVLRVDTAGLGLTPAATPDRLAPNTPTPLTLNVAQNGVTLDPATVRLNYRVDTGPGLPLPDAEVAMTQSSPGVFTASIPGQDCLATVDYWFTAKDTAGKTYVVPQGGGSTGFSITPQGYRAAVHDAPATTAFEDSFNTDKGWTVTNSGLSDGAWTRGIPAGDGSRGDPTSDFDGNGWAFLTDNTPGNSDVDDGTTVLTSPPVNLAGYDAAYVSYAFAYSNGTNIAGGLPDDIFRIQVSSNGTTWVEVETIGTPAPTFWVRTNLLRLNDYITPSATTRVRFVASDLNVQGVVEAGVDAVKFIGVTCSAPAPLCADVNADTELDAFDFNAFVDAFNAANFELADQNNDTELDAFDFNAFVDNFNSSAECP